MTDRACPSALLAFVPVLLLALAVGPAGAQPSPDADADRVVIGVAAPLSGASAALGAQVTAGARAATLGEAGVEIVEADTQCSVEGGTRAAAALVEAGVDVVAGFVCTESMEAALPLLTKAGIPVVDVGVRANRFFDGRARSGQLVWRVAPRSDAEADAAAALLVKRWRDVPFGLVDDGTLYGRGLADAVRTRLETAGLRPATIDTYRPAEEKQFGLVRRILGTGVTRLFVAGERQDVAVIARDALSIDLELDVIGGESLLDAPDPDVPLPPGILAVAPQSRFDTIPAVDGTAPESRQGYFGPAVAATQIALSAVRTARASARPLKAVLDGGRFETALGPVRFDAEGDADLDLFRVFRFDGTDFVAETGG